MMELEVGKTLLLVFLLLVVLATAAIGIYFCIYDRFVNRRIQNKSDQPHGMWPPRTVVMISVASALVLLVGAGIWMSVTAQRHSLDPDAAFPVTVISTEECEDTYLAAYSKDHNPGYTRYTKTENGIHYIYFVRHDALDSMHPAFLIFAEVPNGTGTVGYTARYGERDATERVGVAPGETLLIAGNAPHATTFVLQLYFYDDADRPADGKNDAALATARSTFRLAIAE